MKVRYQSKINFYSLNLYFRRINLNFDDNRLYVRNWESFESMNFINLLLLMFWEFVTVYVKTIRYIMYICACKYLKWQSFMLPIFWK